MRTEARFVGACFMSLLLVVDLNCHLRRQMCFLLGGASIQIVAVHFSSTISLVRNRERQNHYENFISMKIFKLENMSQTMLNVDRI
jgi:hypothetical protein